MGWILGAFSLGYALFHVPGGWLADRFGAQRVLAGAILWFSVFTAMTAIAPSLPIVKLLGAAWLFVVVRFVMGLGEAAAMPVGNKMMAYWLSDKERAFGTSIFLAGVGAGGITAPFLIAWIVKGWGGRPAFVFLGIAGVMLAALWYVAVRDRPDEHPWVNTAELGIIRRSLTPDLNARRAPGKMSVPWLRVLSSPSMWELMISHFCLVYPVSPSGDGSSPFAANPLRPDCRSARQASRATDNLALAQLALAAGFNFAASAVLWTACNDISAKFSGSRDHDNVREPRGMGLAGRDRWNCHAIWLELRSRLCFPRDRHQRSRVTTRKRRPRSRMTRSKDLLHFVCQFLLWGWTQLVELESLRAVARRNPFGGTSV